MKRSFTGVATWLRNRLIMTYAPLVKYIVYREIREVPAHQEAEDYISHGLEG
jgi:RNA polymerase sigma factor for flagellar operon FliA